MLTTKHVANNKVKPCRKCGEQVIRLVTKRGVVFFAQIYQDGHKLAVLVKNGFVTEHRHV